MKIKIKNSVITLDDGTRQNIVDLRIPVDKTWRIDKMEDLAALTKKIQDLINPKLMEETITVNPN